MKFFKLRLFVYLFYFYIGFCDKDDVPHIHSSKEHSYFTINHYWVDNNIILGPEYFIQSYNFRRDFIYDKNKNFKLT